MRSAAEDATDGPDVVIAKAAKRSAPVCRRTRSARSAARGSTGWCARSSAFCTALQASPPASDPASTTACRSGHRPRRPVTSTGAPQLAQLTLWTFRRKLLDLLGRERADEVLLAQEVEERRQPAVRVRAAQILELRGPLYVVGAAQPALAARALGEIRVRTLRPGDLLPDDAEERQRRRRASASHSRRCRTRTTGRHGRYRSGARRPRWASNVASCIGEPQRGQSTERSLFTINCRSAPSLIPSLMKSESGRNLKFRVPGSH